MGIVHGCFPFFHIVGDFYRFFNNQSFQNQQGCPKCIFFITTLQAQKHAIFPTPLTIFPTPFPVFPTGSFIFPTLYCEQLVRCKNTSTPKEPGVLSSDRSVVLFLGINKSNR